VAVCYLDMDDEITGAISRIRAVTDGEAIIVVPPGSRIATSRINFRLLAREAAERKLNVAAVSDEPSVRALAISAGLPAYDSISAAENALVSFREQDRQLAARVGGVPPSVRADPTSPRDAAGTTRVMPIPPQSSVAEGTAVMPAAAEPAARRRRGRRLPIAPLLVLLLVVLLLGGAAWGAYVLLPTASITIHPATSQIETSPFTVTADPNVAVVDPEAGVIPAETISLPLHAEGDFSATGIQARDTRASGSVRFRSENTLNAVPIPADTVVSTADGIDFVTTDAVTVPKASFATGPTTADVAVRAVNGGTDGNVDAGTITELAAVLRAQLISVRNPDPTSGGRHIEEVVISQEDYDTALASLNEQLGSALTAALADPDSVPRGLVAFPATMQLGQATPSQPAESLVGSVAPSFTLALDADAQLLGVNEGLIDEVGEARLRAMLDPNQQLIGDQVVSSHGPGSAVGERIVYQVTARGAGYSDPDVQEIIASVKGKSVSDAQQALARYGSAEILVWPEFVDHLPDQAARISVIIEPPVSGT